MTAVLALLVIKPAVGSDAPPSLILRSGKIVTLDDVNRVVQALAIRDGRILKTGSDEEILRLKNADTRIVDVQGRTVIPGLIDSHTHPTTYGMHIHWPDLSKAGSLAEIVALIEAKVQESKPGEWITNSGIWNETKLTERRNPARHDLDPISPRNPVFLSRGHLGVVNTMALTLLGLTRDTPDPPGGTIERDPETGEPTGRLYERAIDQVRQLLPAPTEEQLMASQRQSYRDFAAAGVTSVRSASDTPAAMRAYIRLRKQNEIPLRTSVAIRMNVNTPAQELEKLLQDAPVTSGIGDEMLSIWGIKLGADGGSDLAYLRKEYLNRPGFRGQPGGSLENFIAAARLFNRYGWRVGTHALGDAAIDLVLDAYEAADRDDPLIGKRWAIEHAYLLQPDHYDRIKRMGLIVHSQTWHLYHLRRNFLENYGREYADMSHPYRTLLQHGINIAGGTDWPLEPHDQFYYLWVAITRKTIDGEVVGPQHRLSRQEALAFHTKWAAYSTFEEDIKGSLEPGKYADLVILSDDYLEVPEDRIKTITPLLTMVGGNVVFRRDGSIIP